MKSLMAGRFDVLSLWSWSLQCKACEFASDVERHRSTAVMVRKLRKQCIPRGAIQESRMFHVDSYLCKSNAALGDS